jgi:formyl-CoA transferase
MTDQIGALAKFKVIDLTRVRAGPTAVRQLADWGADVIKVEAPMATKGDDGLGGPRQGADFQNLHRGKRSITLNLKHNRGVAILKELIRQADVVVENYRPEVKHRLGIDYQALSSINPKLVYGSISGFGQSGPYRDRPGVDQIAQGMSGLMSVTGIPGQGPVRAGIPTADLYAGLHLAIAILAALLERESSGKGQFVSTSLLESQVSMMDFQAARYTIEDHVPEQVGNEHPTAVPMGTYKTSDGSINIAPAGNEAFRRFCQVLGREDLATNEAYAKSGRRYFNRANLVAEISKETVKKTSAEWIEAFNAESVPCGPIYAMDQVFADPQVEHLGMRVPVPRKDGTIDLIANGARMERTPANYRTPAPEAGEHTVEVLRGIGMTPQEIESLRDEGVI